MLEGCNDSDVISYELQMQLKRLKKDNDELRKQLDETIDDLIIAQKNHNSAHDESLRFNQRLIEAEEANEQLKAEISCKCLNCKGKKKCRWSQDVMTCCGCELVNNCPLIIDLHNLKVPEAKA